MSIDNHNEQFHFTKYINSSIINNTNEIKQQQQQHSELDCESSEESYDGSGNNNNKHNQNKNKNYPIQDLALIIFGLFCCDGIYNCN
jgi:hypothetical protein